MSNREVKGSIEGRHKKYGKELFNQFFTQQKRTRVKNAISVGTVTHIRLTELTSTRNILRRTFLMPNGILTISTYIHLRINTPKTCFCRMFAEFTKKLEGQSLDF